jgi:alanyl-tRNA synthetase
MPVTGLQKIGSAIAFQITPEVTLTIGDSTEQQVNISIRRMTANNHTATHLLQAALIELFGKQVKQSGSVVDPSYLRFDFTYHKNLTTEEITQVEDRVNDIIRENMPVSIFETTYKKALEHGAIAIFGEKYNPECVRVIDVPGFSTELCGGTHVPTTGVIGAFKITEVSALSAGNRRIVAVTGPKAVELMQSNFNTVKTLSQEFKVKPDEVIAAVEKQKDALNKAQLELRTLKKQVIASNIHAWAQQTHMIGNVPFVYLSLDGYTSDDLREAANLLQHYQKGLYVLVSTADDKTNFYATLASEIAAKLDFEKIKNTLDAHGLKGGGKAGTLQGGGPRITKDLKAALIKALA